MGRALLLSALLLALATADARKRRSVREDTGEPLPPPFPDATGGTPRRAGAPGSCNGLPGVWTGYVGTRALYDEYDLGYPAGGGPGAYTAVVLAPPPGTGSEGWTFGAGQLSPDNTTTTLTLDNGLTLTGNVSSDCGTIVWDNGSSWARKSGIDVVHVVAMNHLDGANDKTRREQVVCRAGVCSPAAPHRATSPTTTPPHPPHASPLPRTHAVGYNGIPGEGYINNILNRYFSLYFPRALAIAAALRALNGPERFIYTTHPFLLSLYLHCTNLTLSGIPLACPSAEAVAEMRAAIAVGDVVFHAAPFNTEWEMAFNTEMVNFHFQLARDLADELGVPRPSVVSLRDVPGTTRSLVPLMVANNLTAISIGVNDAAPNADMPNPGVWHDPATNTSVLYMQTGPGVCYPYPPGPDPLHPGGMGIPSCVVVPGFNHVLCWNFRLDNSGPPESVEEVLNAFSIARWTFPGAQVYASTFENYTAELATVADTLLPVTVQESGDNWVQSTTAAPLKAVFYRESARAFAACVAGGGCDTSDPRLYNFLRLLVKVPEHTYGMPSYPDTTHWTNEDFHAAIASGDATYLTTLSSYTEQDDIAMVAGMAALADHPLAADINARMAAWAPAVPDVSGLTPVPQASWTAPLAVGGASIALDGVTGALGALTLAGTQWASAATNNTLAAYEYRTFTDANYATQGGYCCWGVGGRQAGGQPNETVSVPAIASVWSGPATLVVRAVMPSFAHTDYGAPAEVWFNYTVAADGSAVYLDVVAINKTATRLGEAIFLSFNPLPVSGSDYEWRMRKLASWIDPLETVTGSSPHSHGISDGVAYQSQSTPDTKYFAIDMLDAPVVSPITPTSPATNFIVPADALAGPVTGFASLLFQNAFNTNTPQFSYGNPNFRWRYVFRAAA
jgi:hypothetical protein